MKYIVSALFALQLATLPAFAQTLTTEDLFERGELDDTVGYTPKSLQSLVGSATIIFKGRFAEHLKHDVFFGYGETKESFKQRLKIDDVTADRLAVPISDYKVEVEEIFLGESEVDSVIYRIFESYPENRQYTNPDSERLFFLVRNPDGTYSPQGASSVLILRDGEYVYDSLTTHSKSFENKRLEFLSSFPATEIETQVKAEIRTQYPQTQ